MQDEIWHQFGIQNYNGNVLSVYSVGRTSTRLNGANFISSEECTIESDYRWLEDGLWLYNYNLPAIENEDRDRVMSKLICERTLRCFIFWIRCVWFFQVVTIMVIMYANMLSDYFLTVFMQFFLIWTYSKWKEKLIHLSMPFINFSLYSSNKYNKPKIYTSDRNITISLAALRFDIFQPNLFLPQ